MEDVVFPRPVHKYAWLVPWNVHTTVPLHSLMCNMKCSGHRLSKSYSSFIHSPRSLPYNRAIASSKAGSAHSVITCFLCQFTAPSLSLTSSSCCLRLLPRLPVTSIPPSIFHSITCLIRKALPTQDVANPVSLPSFYCWIIFCIFKIRGK